MSSASRLVASVMNAVGRTGTARRDCPENGLRRGVIRRREEAMAKSGTRDGCD